jgi:hypothetical protein
MLRTTSTLTTELSAARCLVSIQISFDSLGFISQYYEGAGWKTEEFMAAMMGSDDFYANEIVQVKVSTLHIGRLVLVGNVGYTPGSTGTGTTLAMTGACVWRGKSPNRKEILQQG